MPRDPVCGMSVKDNKDSLRSEYGGQTYYFCSDRCKSEFDRNPSAYASSSARDSEEKQRRGDKSEK